MRIVTAFCALACFASQALAQDFDRPTLRGSNIHELASPPSYRWAGLYGGGQIGFTGANINVSAGTGDLVQYIVRNSVLESSGVPSWTTLSNGSTGGTSWGVFVGYNFQWDQAVLGGEVNYSRTFLSHSAADSMARSLQNDSQAPAGHHFIYDVTVASSASVQITDFATFRARAGWSAGRFLPYMFGGVAVGMANINRSATVTSVRTDVPDVTVPVTPPIPVSTFGPVTQSDNKQGAFAYGVTAGLGVDAAILPNVFLRGEWEFIQFAPVNNVTIAVNTVRAGIGVKF